MKFLPLRIRTKESPHPPRTTSGDREEIDNLGAQFDWMHIPPEESMYTESGGELTDKPVHLELRMLYPPKSALGVEHPRAKLNLFVTKEVKINGLKHNESTESSDCLVAIPRGARYFAIAEMEEPFGYWPKPGNNEIPRFYLMINRFTIKGAQAGYTYLVEGNLQVEGCDHMFKVPSFYISYDPQKAFPEPHVDKWTDSSRGNARALCCS